MEMNIMPPTIASMEAKVPDEVQKKLHESAKQYEGVFMNEMLNIMFKEIDLNPMGSESSTSAEENYKSMMVQQLSGSITNNGPGIGLAQPIYKALLEAQIASQETQK